MGKGKQEMIRVENEVPGINLSEVSEMAGFPFVGKTIAVTGKLKYFTRAGINAKIESLGAKARRTVTKNTDYLICGDKAGSKLNKALSLGVKVISEQEFLMRAQGIFQPLNEAAKKGETGS